ncbi:MAG: tRNA (guanosine(46)-N7)-methyltransferase TrmB [Calditrichaeota bacterium]|nr:MAG: tRNA (guanosine(46)-N7)-methyltransferase TrmB [Calditrichota bacterium]
MSRHKLRKFAAIATASNVLLSPPDTKGNWQKNFFKNTNPIILELGCGRGEYSIALARLNPDKNFLGIDIKGDRLWAGAKIAAQDKLKNVLFMRIDIYDLLNYFAENEVTEIWITFPDPFERGTKYRLRLTSTRYLPMYKKILIDGGCVHFKTDHTKLYEFTKATLQENKIEILEDIADLYNTPIDNINLTIQTAFEKKHLEMQDTIKYLKFKFN